MLTLSNGCRRFPVSTTMRRAFSPVSSRWQSVPIPGSGGCAAKPGDKVFYDHAILLKEMHLHTGDHEHRPVGPRGRGGVYVCFGLPRLKGAVQMVINPVAMW